MQCVGRGHRVELERFNKSVLKNRPSEPVLFEEVGVSKFCSTQVRSVHLLHTCVAAACPLNWHAYSELIFHFGEG